MDGIKKAALFLSGLDCTEADQLLSRLDVESARLIRREIMSLRHDNISVEDAHRLDKEFLHTAGWQPARAYRPPVQEYQFATPRTAPYAPQRPARAYATEEFVPPIRSFYFMRNWSVNDVVDAIIDEHPQTIAVVLAHLPQSQMKSVVSAFPPDLQQEIKHRLDNYEMPEEQVVQEIESVLQVRYRRQQRPTLRSATLESFDDIETLSDSQLATLFRSVDLTTTMLALIGADTTLITRVTKHFSPTEEHEIRKRLKRLNRIDEEDVEHARQSILEQYNGTL